jgi:putative DNA primase/helicase
MQNIEEIYSAVTKRVYLERKEFDAGPETDNEADALFTSKEIIEQLNRNADGDTFIYIELHRNLLAYDCAAGRWYKWGGNFWVEDLTGEALQAVNAVVDVYAQESKRQAWSRTKAAKELNSEAEKSHDDNEKAIIKRIKLLQSLQRKQEIVILSRSGAGTLAIIGDEWDKHPWLFAAANGILDLKTGNFRPGEPDDYIKTASPTEWKGLDEPCPTWENFISEIFGNNVELTEYMQRLLGYGITGLAVHHLFIILFGAGRNGKGTLLETIRAVLGDYAFKTESELLLEQKSARMAGSPNSGVLSLRGRRIVWASETSDGRRLNAGRLKELVGGDTLNARPIFGKHHVQFSPSHLLLLLTNNKPSAPASDYALWQRVNLIPFEKAFVSEPKAPNEYKADPYLCEKLKDEASGILAWLVKGCLAWQKEGLNPPDIVKAATDEYRSDEDTIGHFIEERCNKGPEYQVRGGELYAAWRTWAEASGVTYLSGKKFGIEIKKRGFDSYKDKRGVYYIGISLTGDG